MRQISVACFFVFLILLAPAAWGRVTVFVTVPTDDSGFVSGDHAQLEDVVERIAKRIVKKFEHNIRLVYGPDDADVVLEILEKRYEETGNKSAQAVAYGNEKYGSATVQERSQYKTVLRGRVVVGTYSTELVVEKIDDIFFGAEKELTLALNNWIEQNRSQISKIKQSH